MHEPIVLKQLASGSWKDMPFEPFREGVEICHIVSGEPAVALLRYVPGARVPLHRHAGLETIVVLEGSQRDERGVYNAGDVVVNTPGTSHSVVSEDGCVVLIQWDKPVEIIE